MTIVVDASIAIAWLYPEQYPNAVKDAFSLVTRGGGVVPSLWKLEVANVLRNAVRRKQCDERFATLSLRDLSRLAIVVDEETDLYAWTDTRALSAKYDLTVYDAAYLELALRRELALATCDRELAKAARRAGAQVILG